MFIDLRIDGLNKYFLCPFIACFCLIGASFASNRSIYGKYPFLKNILISISEIGSIIPYLIYINFHKNSSRTSIKKNIKKNQLIYNNNGEEEKCHIQIWKVIILGLVEFLYRFISSLGNDLFNKTNFKFYFMCTIILFLNIFQKCIFKTRIFRHQVAALIIFLLIDIGNIIMIFCDDILKYDLKQIIFILVSNLFYSFELNFIKSILNDSLHLLYKLCILLGVFALCFNIIASIITSIIQYCIDVEDKNKIYLFNYKYYLEDINSGILLEIISIIVFIILNTANSVLKFLTIKNLSANHYLITCVMLLIYSSITLKIQNVQVNQLTFILSIIFSIISFFVQFIFLEIIQLNFCGINKDITFKLGLRSDVNKYMQSFSSTDEDVDEQDSNNTEDNDMYLDNYNEEGRKSKSTELEERQNSLDSSEMNSYIDD